MCWIRFQKKQELFSGIHNNNNNNNNNNKKRRFYEYNCLRSLFSDQNILVVGVFQRSFQGTFGHQFQVSFRVGVM